MKRIATSNIHFIQFEENRTDKKTETKNLKAESKNLKIIISQIITLLTEKVMY